MERGETLNKLSYSPMCEPGVKHYNRRRSSREEDPQTSALYKKGLDRRTPKALERITSYLRWEAHVHEK